MIPEPGRELDALVAEKALGCKVKWVGVGLDRQPTCGCVCEDENCKERKAWGHVHQGIAFGGINAHCQFVRREDDPDEYEMIRELVSYSMDDEPALELLNWLRDKWGSVDIHIEPNVVSVGCDGEMYPGYDLPHAASIAVLKAVGAS